MLCVGGANIIHRALTHSSRMPAALITLAHFSRSLRTTAAISAGELGAASTPAATKRCLRSGSFSTFAVSLTIRSITGFGTPAGVKRIVRETAKVLNDPDLRQRFV